MTWRRENGRIVTTAGVARAGERFFLARRASGGTQHGRWEFPGGKCDDGEPDRVCLSREFREEFEVEIAVGPEISRVPFTHGGEDFVLLGIAIDLLQEPTVLHEHSETGWFTAQQALKLDLTDSDRELLRRIILDT